MRLICPKCGAEYEPPRNMMPSGGRHVQCSACHTRWFARDEGKPMLTEDQIIARLESRTPNLRVVDEPKAAPWNKSREDEAEKAVGGAEPAAAPATADDAEDARADAAETPVKVEADDTGEKAREGAEPKGEEGFTWEAPEADPGDEPTETPDEAKEEFNFEAPKTSKSEDPFTWEGAKEKKASEEETAKAKLDALADAAKVKPASQPDVKPASPDSPLRGAQKSRAAEVIHPKIIVHSEPKSLFWHGFAASVAVFFLLLLLFFAALGLSATESGVGAVARSYVEIVNGLRHAVASILPFG
ncbi:zinc finger domain-containing protein [Amaricoccus macauensis]|uniref:zinc finger domain-containing protein n=1 Tax=Amaricoccus macauensis TaxID=57001 RepID=UPI003C7ADE3E